MEQQQKKRDGPGNKRKMFYEHTVHTRTSAKPYMIQVCDNDRSGIHHVVVVVVIYRTVFMMQENYTVSLYGPHNRRSDRASR